MSFVLLILPEKNHKWGNGGVLKIKIEVVWTILGIAKSKQCRKISSVFFYISFILTHTVAVKAITKYIFGDLALKNISMSKDFVDKKDFLGLYNEWKALHLIMTWTSWK